jgi:ornithine cyclodeaminase
MIRILEEGALRAVVSPDVAIAAVRAAFQADALGRTHVPPVINLDIPSARGEFHVKTAHIEGVDEVAVKVASGFYDNPKHGLPTGSGVMMVFDAATGLPRALLLDNGFLTDLRTAAAGAVAADLLAPRSIDVVGILGSGAQARWQVRCLARVRAIRRILAWSPTRAHLNRYVTDMRSEGYDAVAAGSPEEVCRASDLLITATPSREPLVRAAWLREGQHVTAVGSDSPDKQELDGGCLARADLIVVDRLTQCEAFGELRHAIDAGLLTRNHVHAELGQIVAGQRPGRTNAAQLTIADLTGVGFQDTAIASAALASALTPSDGPRIPDP